MKSTADRSRGGARRTGASTRPVGYRIGPAAKPSLIERLKARKGRVAAVVLVVGGLAFAAGWNPPTTTVHAFTEASDYSMRRESGCTNSGEGCHGTDEGLMDFNAYHPNLECKSCHEYTGVGCIPCHGPGQHECTGCHDGSMEGVSDCVRLTDSYPRGHYRDSLHTAMGTDMDQLVRANVDGKAQAACGDCHSRDLKAAHTGVPTVDDSDYGPEVGCSECHNDKRSGSLQQVLNDWKQHKCSDCHGEKNAAPMHAVDFATSIEASGTAGCGTTGEGCHDNNELHTLHPDNPASCGGAAAEGEPGCHDLELESSEPTVTACGTGEDTCHIEYVNTEYGHKQDGTVHAPEGGAQARALITDAASGVSATCSSCHVMDLGREHDRWNNPLAGDACLGCHNRSSTTVEAVKDSWPASASSRACATCHGSMHGELDTSHESKQVAGGGAEPTCVATACHATTDVRILHAETGCTPSGCHSSSGPISGDAAMSCGGSDAIAGYSCHTTSTRHTGANAAHTATQIGADGTPSTTACSTAACHKTADVRVLHEATGGCFTATCHVAGGPTYMTCGGAAGTPACHTGPDVHATLVVNHTGIEIGMEGAPEPGACTASACHETVDLALLHENASCTVAGCHEVGGIAVWSCGGPAGTAGSCHTGPAVHTALPPLAGHTGIELDPDGAPDPGACTASPCHSTVQLDTLHPTTGCLATGCHNLANPTVVSCGGDATTPNACHTVFLDWHGPFLTKHVGIELGATGLPEPGACTSGPCHDTANLYTLHDEIGCAIVGCHGVPGIASCGGPAGTPNACHTGGVDFHATFAIKHTGIEIGNAGTPAPGACTGTGCHTTVRLDTLHDRLGCAITGCHSSAPLKSCGGPDGTPASCHTPPPETTCTVTLGIGDPMPVSVSWRTTHEPFQSIEATGQAPASPSDSATDSAIVPEPEQPAPVDPPAAPEPEPSCPGTGSAEQQSSEAICLTCHSVRP